jgi:N utilization substance protein A
MNGEELIRLIDAIHRDKDIDKEVLFDALETALLTAVKKRYGERDTLAVEIDRETGDVIAWDGDTEAADVDMSELGRIAAQTAKQVIIQKIRDAERDVIYDEYEHKVGTIVTGVVQRIEGGNVIVNLGRGEGIIPRHEKVRGENYNPGDRVKAVIYDVKKVGPKVKIMLSRSDPDLVRKLFELEVPEIAEHVIEIKSIAREPGYRTKIAVTSMDSRVDCIGACVGIRGTRIKSITDELNGEKIDIIRWSDNIEELIINGLRPATISNIIRDEASKVAEVLVPDDQLSLAIGRKGQNVRLASKLTGYEIQIKSPGQAAARAPVTGEEDPEVKAAREAFMGDAAPSAATPEPAQESAPASEPESAPENVRSAEAGQE